MFHVLTAQQSNIKQRIYDSFSSTFLWKVIFLVASPNGKKITIYKLQYTIHLKITSKRFILVYPFLDLGGVKESTIHFFLILRRQSFSKHELLSTDNFLLVNR